LLTCSVQTIFDLLGRYLRDSKKVEDTSKTHFYAKLSNTNLPACSAPPFELHEPKL
jgi:hypothetical protein